MKSVTVLIPVYNGAEYIENCIKSLLNQTYNNFKILVVNDGSTDNTLEVLKKYPEVNVISYEKNMGISYALNLGIENIDSDYIVRMDSDDISHYDRIRTQVKFMENNPTVFMSAFTAIPAESVNDNKWEVSFGEKKLTTSNELRLFYLYHTYLLHPTVIFRTKEWKEKGYKYNSQFDGVEDFELHRRVIMEEEVYQLHLPLIALTSRDNSASSVGKDKTLHRLYLANKYFYSKHNIDSETIKILAKTVFPKIYNTTKEELKEIEQFTYKLLEKDYFNKRIKREIVEKFFDYLYTLVKSSK